jgi:hypothetical protein
MSAKPTRDRTSEVRMDCLIGFHQRRLYYRLGYDFAGGIPVEVYKNRHACCETDNLIAVGYRLAKARC